MYIRCVSVFVLHVLETRKVSAVTHSISEVERQLRVDEDRLGSLENLKKVS